jgi:hypothetical protein
MKYLAALSALFSLNASASYTVRPISYSPAPVAHSWFCTANGYDYNGQLQSVSGGLKATESEASRDAVRACRSLFSVCRVSSCFQE